MRYQDINAQTIDGWCREGWQWGTPIPHEAYAAAQQGQWDVYLTPTKPVPHAWFGPLAGKRLLGLASGGGQQIPIFTALGARCWIILPPSARASAWSPGARATTSRCCRPT